MNAELGGKDIRRWPTVGALPERPRRRVAWTAIVVLAIALPISLVMHLQDIRESLISRTRLALQGNGLADITAVINGRNVTLTGIVSSPQQREQASVVTRRVPGVRAVNNLLAIASAEPPPLPEAKVKSEPTAQPDAQHAQADRTLEPYVPPVAEETAPPPMADTGSQTLARAGIPEPKARTRSASVNVSSNEGVVTVSGLLPDKRSQSNLLAALDSAYGAGKVVSRLEVNDDVTVPGWLDNAYGMIESFDGGLPYTIEIRDTRLTLSGQADNEDQRRALLAKIESLMPGMEVVSRLRLADPNNELTTKLLADELAALQPELARVRFGFDSTRIRRSNTAILDRVAAILSRYPSITVEVGGHTDASGGRDYNLALSHRRARAVARYLIKGGIASNRIVARGHGASRPITKDPSLEGQARNRRIEITVFRRQAQ